MTVFDNVGATRDIWRELHAVTDHLYYHKYEIF